MYMYIFSYKIYIQVLTKTNYVKKRKKDRKLAHNCRGIFLRELLRHKDISYVYSSPFKLLLSLLQIISMHLFSNHLKQDTFTALNLFKPSSIIGLSQDRVAMYLLLHMAWNISSITPESYVL